jgi:hypothetical protein
MTVNISKSCLFKSRQSAVHSQQSDLRSQISILHPLSSIFTTFFRVTRHETPLPLGRGAGGGVFASRVTITLLLCDFVTL